MFEIGWQEIVLIAIIALIFIGPDDLPQVMYTLGKWARKARTFGHSLQQILDQAADTAELEDLRRKVQNQKVDEHTSSTSSTSESKTSDLPPGEKMP